MTRWNIRRAVAAVLVFSLCALVATPQAGAAGAAMLQGRVLDADGGRPISDVVVTLFDSQGTSMFPAAPTDARGVFHAQAPAGSYRLVAKTEAGAFLASNTIHLAAGSNAPLALTLRRQAAPDDPVAPPPAIPPPASGKKAPLAPWAKWTIIGGIAVASILAIDAVTSDESSASGF